MGRFNIPKISKSILEFNFLSFYSLNVWNLCCLTVSNKHFSWNETKRVILNTDYLGCSDCKFHKCSCKLCQFLSLSQIGLEKNINHNPCRGCDCPFWSSFIYLNKSKYVTNCRFRNLSNFLFFWYWTNILDSYFWNDRRINHRSCSVKLVNVHNNRYNNYSYAYSSRGFVSLLYLLWIS